MEEQLAPFIGPELRFPCDKCERSFRVETNLEIHEIVFHTSNENYPETQKPFKEQPQVNSKSSDCDIVFIDPSLQDMPDKSRREKRVRSIMSGSNFLEKEQLLYPNKPYRCEFCDKRFRHLSLLRTHQLAHRDNDVKNFECTICRKAFKWRESLRGHMYESHRIRVEPVETRNILFWPSTERKSEHANSGVGVKPKMQNRESLPGESNRSSSDSKSKSDSIPDKIPVAWKGVPWLDEEAKSVNQPGRRKQKIEIRVEQPELVLVKDPPPPVLPTKPKSQVKTKATLYNTSSLERKYPCQICGKRFLYRSSLRRHMIWHQAPRYKCPHPACPKSFHRKSLARVHMNSVHLRQANFKSFYCDRVFIHSGTRNKHHKVHEEKGICLKAGESTHTYFPREKGQPPNPNKKHDCDICGRGFRRKKLLKIHELDHEDVRNFHCKKCRMVYKARESLRNHMRRTHPVQRIRLESIPAIPIPAIPIPNKSSPPQNPCQCKLCVVELRTRTLLDQHIYEKHRSFVKLKELLISTRRVDEFGMCMLELQNLPGSQTDPLTQWFMCDKCLLATCNIQTATSHRCKSNDSENDLSDNENNYGVSDAIYFSEVKVEDEELIPPEDIKIEFPYFES